jgi:glutamate N-acetyltransferase/amino-acid N-acetyltransferase
LPCLNMGVRRTIITLKINQIEGAVMNIDDAVSAITKVRGFRAVGVVCGLKESGNPDLALVLSKQSGPAAAMFTRNSFKAAPVKYDMTLLERVDRLQGVIINAGNANAVTGRQGLLDAAQMAHLAEAACGLPADSMFVMSTGVIGEKLPMDKLASGIELAARLIETEAGLRGDNASLAIMTTDLVPKEAFREVEIDGRWVRLAGMAKGSGMIEPNMATMLAVLVTDAVIEPAALQMALMRAVNHSFNRITVDGDTSTNDTVSVLASEQAGNVPIAIGTPSFDTFVSALTDLSVELAQAIARDGEGATKLVEIVVNGASSEAEAAQAAKTVANSPLVKTALYGADPNWGRVLMAVGRSGVQVNPDKTDLQLGDFQLVLDGEPQQFDATEAGRWLASMDEVQITLDLGVGSATATVWSCDLSYKYIEINAEYHT